MILLGFDGREATGNMPAAAAAPNYPLTKCPFVVFIFSRCHVHRLMLSVHYSSTRTDAQPKCVCCGNGPAGQE